MKAVNLEAYDLITFDCYGTLIDWESGLLQALKPWLAVRHRFAEDDEILEQFARIEPAAEQPPFKTYREVLRTCMRELAGHWNLELAKGEDSLIADSLQHWKPFPDTVAALGRLASHCKLAVLSNVDDDLFLASAAQLKTAFSHVVTAQQVRCYKPAPGHFMEIQARTGLTAARILHVAQSVFHDIIPARRAGMTTVWINRRAGKAGAGATAPAAAEPDFQFPDLASFAHKAFR